MKKATLAVLALVLVLGFILLTRQKSGFRGEAIGGRTGGDAYSGASAQLDPGMP